MIIWSMSMRKYAHIFKLINIILFFSVVFSQNYLVKTSDGFKVTNPEGYVAIDRISGNAVKLVDRMEFSFNNFTAIKNWDK